MNNFLFPSSVRPLSGTRLRCLQRALWLGAALLCLCANVRAQTAGELAPPSKPKTFTIDGITTTATPSTTAASFKLEAGKMVSVSSKMKLVVRQGHPFVEAEINGKPALFLIDTGARINLVTREAADRLGLKILMEAKIPGADGKEESMAAATFDSMKVGNFVYSDQAALVYKLPDGFQCDGILGEPFISSQVITLDYENETLELTRNQDFVAAKEDVALPLVIAEDQTPMVGLEWGGKPELFDVDTGSNFSVLLYTAFVERNKLREAYQPAVTANMGEGIGGLLKGDYVRLPNLKLGKYELTKMAGVLSRATSGPFAGEKSELSQGKAAGNIGGQIWQRFTLTLDYKNARAYLRPNSLYNEPFEVPNFGAAISGDKIVDIAPNSPAQEAGLVVGDTILMVDNKTFAELRLLSDGRKTRRPSGTKMRFKVRSADGKEREVTVTLRDLI